jgi:hypothetical protein
MRIQILALTLLTSVPLFAADSVVVKTFSQSLNGELILKGSGVVLKENNRTFVLTSDHVVIQESKLANYSIQDDHGVKYNAVLVRSDILTGLAILEIKQNNNLKTITFNDFAQTNTTANSGQIQTAGFAIDSEGLSTDAQAKILSTTSTRFNYFDNQEMIEIAGHGEKGMSGGALLTASGKFLGTLSHKYTQDNHVMAIPASTSQTWIKDTIANEETYKILKNYRPLEGQIQNKDLILLDGMQIEALPFKNIKNKGQEELKKLLPNKKLKIVASGTDPIGIGGEEEVADNAIILKLGTKGEKYIVGTYSMTNKKITSIHSTEHYLTLIGKGEAPVTVSLNNFESLNTNLKQINKLAIGISADIELLESEIVNLPMKYQGPTKALLQKIKFFASLAASDLAVVIESNQLQQVLASSLWNDFSDTDVFFTTTNILANLEKIHIRLLNIK